MSRHHELCALQRHPDVLEYVNPKTCPYCGDIGMAQIVAADRIAAWLGYPTSTEQLHRVALGEDWKTKA